MCASGVKRYLVRSLSYWSHKTLESNKSDFCTPHASLSDTQKTTPAMAAGITDHCWTMHELLSFHVPLSRWTPPKQRGRPSHALKRLIERWGGDHG
jgi:hypothetical protein